MKLKLALFASFAVVLTACGASEPDDEAYGALVEIVEAGKDHFQEKGNLASFTQQKIAEQLMISEEYIFGKDVMLPVYGGVKIYDMSENTYRVSIGSVSKDACVYITTHFAEGLQGHGLEVIKANSKVLWSGGEVAEDMEARCSLAGDRAEFFRFDFNVTR